MFDGLLGFIGYRGAQLINVKRVLRGLVGNVFEAFGVARLGVRDKGVNREIGSRLATSKFGNLRRRVDRLSTAK